MSWLRVDLLPHSVLRLHLLSRGAVVLSQRSAAVLCVSHGLTVAFLLGGAMLTCATIAFSGRFAFSRFLVAPANVGRLSVIFVGACAVVPHGR